MWRSRPVRRILSRARRPGGDHLSERSRERPGAEALVRPTRELGRAALERSLLGLAPGGACRAGPVTRPAGELLPHRFTLTARAAVCSLLRFPRVAPPGCYPAPCPAESGRSSSVAARGRPAGSSAPSIRTRWPRTEGRAVSCGASMRVKAAFVLLSAIVFGACTNDTVGPAAPIDPAQLTPAPALDASAARETVVQFVDAYRDSPTDGIDPLKALIAGPDLATWARWLDVQNGEFDGTIQGVADVRDVEFVGALTTPRATGASVGLSASVGFRFSPANGDESFDRIRILDGPVTLLRTSPGAYRVFDLVRDGVPMSDSIQPFRHQSRSEGDVTVTMDSLFMFMPNWQFNMIVTNDGSRAVHLAEDGAALFVERGDGFDRVPGTVAVTPSLETIPAGQSVEGLVGFRAQRTADGRVFSLTYGQGKDAMSFQFPLSDLVTQVPPPPPTDQTSATVSAVPS